MIPVLDLALPRPVTALHQIEITSRCNLRCPYCAHPKMPRAKQDMDRDTYARAIDMVDWFRLTHGQQELNLAGIGESTMHPDFLNFVQIARETLGSRMQLVLATNGVNMTPETARELAECRVHVYVSLHRPEKAGPAIEMLKKAGCLAGASADPSIAAVNWAGQVNWHSSAGQRECPWIRQGWAVAFSDGRLGTCCFDGQGTDGIIGTVHDDPSALRVAPYSLCPACDQTIGVRNWEQKAGGRYE